MINRRNRRISRFASGAIAAAAVLGACSSDGPSAADIRTDALGDLAANVMVPAYELVAMRTAGLATAIDTACAASDGTVAQEPARQAWSDARAAWLATRSFRFGPATTLRTMSSIDFAIDGDKIDALVDGDGALDAAALGKLGADQRGMRGIEYVLYGEDPIAGRRCDYLVGASTLVERAGAAVLAGWTTTVDGALPFSDQLGKPGSGGMYATEADAYEDVVNGLVFAIAEVADAQIGRASGDVTGEPSFAEVDAGRAQRAKQEAIDVVTGVRAVFDGTGDDQGVRSVVRSISADVATTVDERFATALVALDAIPQPLATNTDATAAHDAYVAIKAVQTSLRADVASLLGVTLTFGDADGDS